MHAALNVRPFGEGPALVIGSGPIVFGVIWSLRAAGFQGELVAQVKRHHEADIAKSLGASLVWARELEVKGFLTYGLEDSRGARSHTFQITHDMLVETGAPVEAIVTHVFPLGEYRDALSADANRRQSGSIKVLLEPAG